MGGGRVGIWENGCVTALCNGGGVWHRHACCLSNGRHEVLAALPLATVPFVVCFAAGNMVGWS